MREDLFGSIQLERSRNPRRIREKVKFYVKFFSNLNLKFYDFFKLYKCPNDKAITIRGK